MPLHLLGKKSWNVYSKDNVERVRRDEAAAIAREEEEDRRLQAYDAEKRIASLRGQTPPSPPKAPGLQSNESQSRHVCDPSSTDRRKRRRLAGEDDTDRDVRLAREVNEAARTAQQQLFQVQSVKHNASLEDEAGHINLFPRDASGRSQPEQNAEAALEKKRKAREYEDQYTMRFANASGGIKKSEPWYAQRTSRPKTDDAGGDGVETSEVKQAWGRADPRRKERERARGLSNDPLAFMKRAQKQLKQSETDRERWRIDRHQETRQFATERHMERRRRRCGSRHESIDDLDLDSTGPAVASHTSSRNRGKPEEVGRQRGPSQAGDGHRG